MSAEDNVSNLPVRFKQPVAEERVLFAPYEVGKRTCFHQKFIIDGTNAKVTCKDCGEQLDPMWCLTQLCNRDAQFARSHDRYAEEMKRLDERTRTKCVRCGHLTPISRR